MPKNNIKISTHDGTVNIVDHSTMTSVKKAVNKINSMFLPEVFNNIHIHIASDFSNLSASGSALNNYLRQQESSFSATRGITTDDSERKEIFIQESAFWTNKLLNVFSKLSFSADDEIEQATLHEFGHQFDHLGADETLMKKHQKLVNKYYDVQFEEFQILPEEEKVMEEYLKNNGYSDRDDYKKALEKDLKNLKHTSSISFKFGYLYAEFYNRGLDVVPNLEDIENADYSRGELFAQSFSYILGGNDGNKEEFIKTFPNTYKVVEKYINSLKL